MPSFIRQFRCDSLVDGFARYRRCIGCLPAVRAGRLPSFAIRGAAFALAAFTGTLDFKALVVGSNSVEVWVQG